MFVDGMCDIGVIMCEIFNIECVEIIKGFDGVYGGCGGVGGSINLIMKVLYFGMMVVVSVGFGIDCYCCFIVDGNW